MCGDQSITINELVVTTANFLKIKPKIEYFKENKINKLIGCNQKIKKITGIKFQNFYKIYPEYLKNIMNSVIEEKVILIDLDKEIPKTSEYMYDSMLKLFRVF